MKKRVTGIGGVFFKAKDPRALLDWYAKHLGVPVAPDHPSAMFMWPDPDYPGELGLTVFSPFAADTDYFQPSQSSFMINFRVENLEELLAVLKEEGIDPVGEPQHEAYGSFAWIMDPEGNKVELWEPKAPPES